ncbi:AfsR/SARP family transcriptional regulator, partial [Streptomyces palmae]
MRFSLLGPVTVTAEGGELPLGPPKRRSVLAMLLLQPNTTVSVDQLTDSVWEEEPPAHARTVIQGHVSKLRATLAEGGAAPHGVELTTQGSAYLLRLPASLVDAHRFSELAAQARPESAPGQAVDLLREALSLWRGPALTGTVSSPPFAAAAHALEERRLAAVEALATAYGALGEHDRATAVLSPHAAAHPLREGLVAALMLALYRAGRQSDALECYHRTRRMLADELGVDPGERLSGAYQRILAGAPSTPAAQPPAQRPAAPGHEPGGTGFPGGQGAPGGGYPGAAGFPAAQGDTAGAGVPGVGAVPNGPGGPGEYGSAGGQFGAYQGPDTAGRGIPSPGIPDPRTGYGTAGAEQASAAYPGAGSAEHHGGGTGSDLPRPPQ